LSMEAIQKIALQLTLGLHRIHQSGIIHCDLKPHNVMVDTSNGMKQLKFIDFGLIVRIIINGKHVESKSNAGVRGTLNYMSRNGHKRETLSIRDDWESLCYLIYSLVAKLPWAGTGVDEDEICRMKQEFLDNKVWQGKLPDVFEKYVSHVFNLGFEE